MNMKIDSGGVPSVMVNRGFSQYNEVNAVSSRYLEIHGVVLTSDLC